MQIAVSLHSTARLARLLCFLTMKWYCNKFFYVSQWSVSPLLLTQIDLVSADLPPPTAVPTIGEYMPFCERTSRASITSGCTGCDAMRI
jgi:hypothetical protein